MASTNDVNQTTFLSLPPEIRNRIYDYHLIMNDARHGRPTKVQISNISTTYYKQRSALALLQTCHQIHDEAEGIFFATNHLQVFLRDVVAIRCIFGMMGTVRCEAIRRLTVMFGKWQFCSYDGDSESTVSKFAWELKRLEGLEVLQIKMEGTFYKNVVDKLLSELWGVAISLANLTEVSIEWGIVFEKLDESSLATLGCKDLVLLEANLQSMLAERREARARWAAGDSDGT